MKINNIYLCIAVPAIVLGFIFLPQSRDFLSSIIVEYLNLFGYDRPDLSAKLSRFMQNSLPDTLFGKNLIYTSLLILWISLGIYYFINYKKYAFLALACAFFSFPILNLFVEAVWIRRAIFSILILPALPKIWSCLGSGIALLGESAYFKRLLKSLAGIFLLILLIPGFYFPPFFDGIAGWYIENNSPKSYNITEIRVRFSNNSTVWFRASLFNPITLHSRPWSAISKRDFNFYNSTHYFHFLHNLYSKAYPSLANQRLPTEATLGRFAYKPHTLDRFDSREEFLEPSQIVAFEMVEIINDESGDRSETILQSWSR